MSIVGAPARPIATSSGGLFEDGEVARLAGGFDNSHQTRPTPARLAGFREHSVDTRTAPAVVLASSRCLRGTARLTALSEWPCLLEKQRSATWLGAARAVRVESGESEKSADVRTAGQDRRRTRRRVDQGQVPIPLIGPQFVDEGDPGRRQPDRVPSAGVDRLRCACLDLDDVDVDAA